LLATVTAESCYRDFIFRPVKRINDRYVQPSIDSFIPSRNSPLGLLLVLFE